VLRRVAGSVAATHPIRWTDIVLDCGYFDQAHFNPDFLSFSGINPSCYFTKRTEFQNHIVLQDWMKIALG
jgi:AraC-like DNA-binding protein